MAIGFEFATGIKIVPGPSGTALPKGARLSRGLGWTMVVDGDEAEFVVAAVPESDLGRSQLQMNLSMLVRFVRLLEAKFADRTAHHQPRRFNRDDMRQLFPNAPDFTATNEPAEPIASIPQVSVGIRLARLRKLFRALSDPTSAAAEQFLAGGGGSARSFYANRLGGAGGTPASLRDPNWAGHDFSARMRGFLSLIALYLKQGDADTSVGAVKYLTFVMSRTSFGALFNSLPQDEREHYRAAPDQWVSLLCTTVMTASYGGAIASGERVIRQRVTDRGRLTGDNRATIPIRRDDWLKAMTQGRDLLSADANPIEGSGSSRRLVTIYRDSNPGLGHRLRGLAGLGDKMDEIDYKNATESGAILEFRARQKQVPLDEWGAYALKCFDFFRLVNEGDRHTPVDFEEEEEA